jgi:uroporphyrinogen-III synthase
MEPLPLQGKTVIITRPKDQAAPFARLLRDRGAEVLYFPTIEIVPPASWTDVDDAIEQNRTYDALVFTSSNAVRFYFERARSRGIGTETFLNKTIYVLGAKTAEAASFYGISAVRFPGVRNAQDLAEALIASAPRHRHYLIPKGRLAGSGIADALRAHGNAADEVIVYETIMPEGADSDSVRDVIGSGKADVLTFFSPSSVENFFSLMHSDCALHEMAVAAIGETTAAALRALQMRVDIVPGRPDADEFAAAIEQYFTGTLHIHLKNEDL